MKETILIQAEHFVKRLLTERLPVNRLFHNLSHTLQVVEAVKEICFEENVLADEVELVTLAAWFHDTGHIEVYKGHEEVSKKIAKQFLSEQQYDNKKIAIILDIINGTIMPQQPSNNLQQIMCDADLYHLSIPKYCILQHTLRQEWSELLNLHYSDEDWQILNIAFLFNHHYLTEYGKNILAQKKAENIIRCKALLGEIRHQK